MSNKQSPIKYITQHLSFDGDINQNSFEKLSEKLDNCINYALQLQQDSATNAQVESEEYRLHLVLYFSSEGGICHIAKYILDQLKTCNSIFKLTIKIGFQISSAASEIMLSYPGEIEFLYDTVIMFHSSSYREEVRDILAQDGWAHVVVESIKKENKKFIEKYKSFFTKEQIESYNKGREIYITIPEFFKMREYNLNFKSKNSKTVKPVKPVKPVKSTKTSKTLKAK